jgi:SpoVK/Ycf46/Vps4 family AAA+-type ATPase
MLIRAGKSRSGKLIFESYCPEHSKLKFTARITATIPTNLTTIGDVLRRTVSQSQTALVSLVNDEQSAMKIADYWLAKRSRKNRPLLRRFIELSTKDLFSKFRKERRCVLVIEIEIENEKH